MVMCNHWANGQSTWYVVSRTAEEEVRAGADDEEEPFPAGPGQMACDAHGGLLVADTRGRKVQGQHATTCPHTVQVRTQARYLVL